MRLRIRSSLVTGVLIVLLIFGALSSFAGAVMAIAFNGAGVPLEYLADSPFDSYLVPGLILAVLLGIVPRASVAKAGAMHQRAAV
jgi:uncharacterized membrane protein